VLPGVARVKPAFERLAEARRWPEGMSRMRMFAAGAFAAAWATAFFQDGFEWEDWGVAKEMAQARRPAKPVRRRKVVI